MQSVTIQVQTKAGPREVRLPKMSHEEMKTAVFEGGAFCIRCGQEVEGIEPDAKRAPCPCCGQRGAYGLEEMVLRGWVLPADPEEVKPK